MGKNQRKYLIAGNWKMNKTADEAVDLVEGIKSFVGRITEVGVVVCPPFTALAAAVRAIEDSTIQIGAQNMHHEAAGAYTGEVSPTMLRQLFVTFVILGHSERRALFGETDEWINRKVHAALQSSLRPILCLGETLEEREQKRTLEVVGQQLEGCLQGVKKQDADQVVIAYEPVWAIGTGRTATPEMAQEVHQFIRGRLGDLFGKTVANRIRILYGGSMKPENAAELLEQPDIDGGLIGGASLEAKSFVRIIEAAEALGAQ